MEGWMKYRQKGGIVGRIAGLREYRYWFVLTNNCVINGFKDESSVALGKPDVSFNLLNAAITICQDTTYQFEITTERQSLLFTVDKSDDTLTWVSAIQTRRSIKQGVSPAPNKLLKSNTVSESSGNLSNNNAISSETGSSDGRLVFDDPLNVPAPLSAGLSEFEWDNEINSFPESPSLYSPTLDESSALFQLSRELSEAKAELTKCRQRILSYQEVLASRDRQLFQIQDEMLNTEHGHVTSEAYRNLEEQIKSYRDQNALLNEEVLKLHQMNIKMHVQAEAQRKKSDKLGAQLNRFQRAYVAALSHCVYRPLVEPDEGARLTIPEHDRHIANLKHLIHHLKVTNDRILGCATPTVGKTEHIDTFGFVHSLPNEALQIEYIGHHLQDALDVLAENNKEEANNLKKWKMYIQNNPEQFEITPQLRKLVLRGIPSQYRAYTWQKLIAYYVGDIKRSKGEGYFETLLDKQEQLSNNKSFIKNLKQIIMDVPRTMPNNREFVAVDSVLRDRLQRVLTAFCIHSPNLGYCQGFNFLVAGCLLFLEEEDAFWFLVAVTDKIFPPDYYRNGLAGLLADQYVLQQILSQTTPRLMDHLMRFPEVDIAAVTTGWFLGLFFDCLPFKTVLRVWDSFLAFGHEAIYRISCVMFKMFEPRLLELHDSSHLLHAVKNIPKLCSHPLDLINEAFTAPFPAWEEVEEQRAQLEVELSKKHEQKMQQRRYYDKRIELLDLCEDNSLFRSISEDKWAFDCGAVGKKNVLSANCRSTQNSQIYEVDSSNIISLSLPIISRVMCVHVISDDIILVGLITGQVQAYSITGSHVCWSMSFSDIVLCIISYKDMIYVGTADGKLHVLKKEEMKKPMLKDSIELSKRPTTCMCVIELESCLWVASGPAIYIVSVETYETDGFFLISSRLEQVSVMLRTSTNVWIATMGSPIIQLYDGSVHSKPPLLVYDVERDISLPPIYPMLPDDERNPDASPANRVISMVLPTDESVWVGTASGEIKMYQITTKKKEESSEETLEQTGTAEASELISLTCAGCKKYSEWPIRCLLKSKSHVLSCSGCYGDDESVKLWTLNGEESINIEVPASDTSSVEQVDDVRSLGSSSRSIDGDSRISEAATDTWRAMKKTATSTAMRFYRDKKPNFRRFMGMLGTNQNN